jgi:hypothetical protein
MNVLPYRGVGAGETLSAGSELLQDRINRFGMRDNF